MESYLNPGGNIEFPPIDFDDWAATYDEAVAASSVFPFLGYNQVLDRIVDLTGCAAGQSVLDLGTGTGNLLSRFSAMGCDLWGSDFSPEMLKLALFKLPQATWILADLRDPWPPGLNRRFDRIVSGYTFHHFEIGLKIRLCEQLVQDRLGAHGRLVIGDISFPTRTDLERARSELGSDWEEEYYWVADEAVSRLREAGLEVSYTQVSSFAGVYLIQGPVTI